MSRPVIAKLFHGSLVAIAMLVHLPTEADAQRTLVSAGPATV